MMATGCGAQSVSLLGPFILESRKLRPRKKAGFLCLCLAQQLSIFGLVIVPAEFGFIPWIEMWKSNQGTRGVSSQTPPLGVGSGTSHIKRRIKAKN